MRSYNAALRRRLLPAFERFRLADIRRVDLEDFAAELLVEGLDPSSIRNILMPMRTIYRRALARGEVAANPTLGLALPAVRGRRTRIASATEAAELLAALPEGDRALWATAFYAGPRRGELQALTWADIDLKARIIRIERAWDEKAREYVAPKSAAGHRRIPVADVLHRHLAEHRLATARLSGLVFGASPDRPFSGSAVWRRARRAWAEAGLEPIGLHECRHTFASLMIDSGVHAKALSSYLGHAGVAITLDRYGHLMPGNEREAGALLDAYLASKTAEGGD